MQREAPEFDSTFPVKELGLWSPEVDLIRSIKMMKLTVDCCFKGHREHLTRWIGQLECKREQQKELRLANPHEEVEATDADHLEILGEYELSESGDESACARLSALREKFPMQVRTLIATERLIRYEVEMAADEVKS